MIGAVIAMQAAQHDKRYASSSIGPTLAKSARMGHPHFIIGKNERARGEGWATRRVTGNAGELAENTKLGRDPFSPSQVSWRCPLGHSVVTAFLSELYLHKNAWDGSDIAVTSALFGQGRNLLRPTPLIIISQRMYRAMREAGLKGFSVEVAHLV
ncbi:MAG: hypothetical protein WBP73_12780 [Terriglobales bacterium]